MEANGSSRPREFSLHPEEFPPLPDSDQTNSAAVAASASIEVPEDIADDNGLEVEEININLVLNAGEDNELNIDENNDNPLNMLHNMLQAFAVNPDQVQRVNHPRLQNHMNLNQPDMEDEMEVIIDVGNDIGPMLDLFAAEQLARDHNVQVGFILDGVIDIMNEEVVRSRWLCVEDDQGHITYTLKISVEL